jgi:hypothetical protein
MQRLHDTPPLCGGEEYLTDEYKTFLHILRVLEEARNPIIRSCARTGRIPYHAFNAFERIRNILIGDNVYLLRRR